MLRAQQRAANAKAAVNAVAKALDQQIKRFKRHTYRGERGRSATRGAPEEIETFYPNTVESTESARDGAMVTDAAFPDGQVVRLKEFNMEPTSVNDAAAQMQFLGHDFFMFLDSESDKHSVLYLRGDGNYGMIQPK
jgi:putative sigma-54 modulation protein